MARRRRHPSCGNAMVVVALVAGCVQVLVATSWVPRATADETVPAKKPPKPLAAGAREPAEAKPRAARPDTPTGRLLNELELAQFGDEAWAEKLRALIQLGPDAVPELIEELDATDNDRMLRCLGFVLRGIGDKRAVAPLIRAIPRTLRPPGSDMGLIAKDKALLEFMQKHDLDPEGGGLSAYYGVGRPVREICGALRTLTGKTQDDEEIYSVFLRGSARQKRLQRRLYHDGAQRWADWWTINWSMHLKNKDDARVDLPAGPQAESLVIFPHGPQATIAFSTSGHIAESVRNPKGQHVFFDLDTGRDKGLPERLRARVDGERSDEIIAWAAREGFDLMGTEYEEPFTGEKHFVIRPLGMTAWQVENDRWQSIDQEVTGAEPLELGTPAAGILSPFDEASGKFSPEDFATFLFVTREGTCGILFVGAEVNDTNVIVGVPARGDTNRDPVGFYKGRRFGFKIIAEREPDDAK